MAFVPDEAIMRSHELSPSAWRLYQFHCMCRDHEAGISRAGHQDAQRKLTMSRSAEYAAYKELKGEWLKETAQGVTLLVGSFECVDERARQRRKNREARGSSSAWNSPGNGTPKNANESRNQDELSRNEDKKSRNQDSYNKDVSSSYIQHSSPANNTQSSPTAQIEAAQKKPQSSADPRSSNPAIQAVRSIMCRYPDRIWYDELIEILGDEPDTQRLLKCRKEWVGRGWNSNALDWVRWYREGIPERSGNNAKNGRSEGRSSGDYTQPGERKPTRDERIVEQLSKQDPSILFPALDVRDDLPPA